MKNKFSTKWKASKQPRKQRKYLANAPLHIKQNLMNSPLSKDLKKKHKIKNLCVRKEDIVKVTRGKFKGKQGKVLVVDRKNLRVSVEGVQRTKKDGNKTSVWFNPSKIILVELKEDKKRMKRIGKINEDKKEKKVGDNKNKMKISNKQGETKNVSKKK